MITEQRVNEVLRYEHHTGRLYWRHGSFAGAEAGTLNSDGYRVIKIDRRRYMAARLIYLLEFGYIPRLVRRSDGDKENNHITNLVDFDEVKRE